MSDEHQPINNVAALANVSRFAQMVIMLQNRAPGLPGMGCFYGPAGLGKSTAGIFGTNKFNACHIQALPFGGTKKLLEMIVVELRVKPARTVSGLFDQAAYQLSITDRPLIIDEADQILSDKMIEAVRHLHDQTQVPVILMGEESLPQQLRRWERVSSRVLSWVAAEEATLQDVDLLAPIYAPRLTLGPDLKAALLAASRGSIRNVSTNLANVATTCAMKGVSRMSLAEWGGKPFHSGDAPMPRRGLAQGEGLAQVRRRSVA
ncbi:AAA family ATPase [Cypionkella psychrotolerans]|uniref:AAA family ATPase n=1 Tax=Cypionkella psychrotolerans TaxID=1678131 RepID=UPI0006B54B5F|nr:ATP-binding protein [Cypionkella psychrotolerans]